MIKDTDKTDTGVVMALITNVSRTTAWRMLRTCREHYKLLDHQILLVRDFRKYYGI